MTSKKPMICSYCGSTKISRFRMLHDEFHSGETPPRENVGNAVYIHICISCGRVLFSRVTLKELGVDSVVL